MSVDKDNELALIRKIVNTFLGHENVQSLIPKKESDKESVFNDMVQLLLNKNEAMFNMNPNKNSLTPEMNLQQALHNRDFLEELTLALTSTLSEKELSQDPKKNFLDNIKSIFSDKQGLEKLKDPKFDPKKIQDPKELKEFLKALDKAIKELKPQEQEKAQKEFKQFLAEMANELKKLELLKPKDPALGATKAKSEEEIAKKATETSMYGIMEGGTLAVVQCFLGNALGLTDWNPNSGNAQIDLENKVDDTQFGDPNARNASAMGNYLQFSGGTFVDTFENDLRSNGAIPSTAPTPHAPGSLPTR